MSIADLDGLFAAAGADDDLDSVEQAQRLAAYVSEDHAHAHPTLPHHYSFVTLKYRIKQLLGVRVRGLPLGEAASS